MSMNIPFLYSSLYFSISFNFPAKYLRRGWTHESFTHYMLSPETSLRGEGRLRGPKSILKIQNRGQFCLNHQVISVALNL